MRTHQQRSTALAKAPMAFGVPDYAPHLLYAVDDALEELRVLEKLVRTFLCLLFDGFHAAVGIFDCPRF